MKEKTISWYFFDYLTRRIANEIKQSGIHISTIYGIPRGGLVVAVRLSHLLDIPLITEIHIRNDTLVVDDIIDSGNQMAFAKYGLNAALFWNPNALFKPKFYGMERPDDTWIIFPWEVKI